MKRINNDTLILSRFDSVFSDLPDENDINYTINLKKTVMDNDLLIERNDIEAYLNNINSRYRFAAFYALLIIFRQFNQYSKYNSCVNTYINEFVDYNLYKVIMSTYFRNKGILGEKDEYYHAIRFAEEACTDLPANLAVKHHYAETVAFIIEEKVVVDIAIINKAIERIDDVIIVYSKHAKYYCTQGRLFAANGDYQRGIANIKKVLDLEEIAGKDSLVRIGQYNYYLIQIKMLSENEQLDGKIGEFNSSFSEVKNNLDLIKTQYLEYLAFFSSILAFILITGNIAITVNDFNKSAGIILMFTGSLIIVFVIFRTLLYFTSDKRYSYLKMLGCCSIGMVFLVMGFLLGNLELLLYNL